MSEVAVAGIRGRDAAPIMVRAATPRFSTQILHGWSASASLLPEWNRLAELQAGTTVFQLPDVLQVWAHWFEPDGNELITVVVREGGAAVLIWPLQLEKSALGRVARGAGVPVGQYDELLVDPGCDATAAFEQALAALRADVKPDLVRVERVRADGALRNVLRGTTPLVTNEAAPYADLSKGFATFMSSLKTRVARQQRKRMKRFEQEGEVGFAVASTPELAERWLREAIALKAEWLSSTGRVSRAFLHRETIECLAELSRLRSPHDALPRVVVSRLTLDGRTAAIEMGFRQGRSYHLYLGAFAPEFAKLGPGNVLTEKLLRWCSENGIERYDMMAPRYRNKAEWQTAEVEVADFALPLTLRGRLYVNGILHVLIPTARKAFYRLPPRLRSTLARVALRNMDGAPQEHTSEIA